jgi:peptidoglycan/xylan/chitin deacetylase (PgdA/CDA1 family)
MQEREIAGCRAALARAIGRPVDLFAYPYGALDRQVTALVRRSCRWGLSCDERSVEASFDAARVPRLDVKPWDVETLAARIERLFTPAAQHGADDFLRMP